MELDKLYKRNSNPSLFDDEQDDTNCGSFALNVTKWYTPYLTDDTDNDDELWQYEEYEREAWAMELLREGHTREEVMEAITNRDFEFILKTCPWLIPINESEIDLKDRVVAYRLSLEEVDDVDEFDMDELGDFHFRVLIDGEWWEKNGAGPVHRVEDPEQENWVVDDWLIYDGPIMYAKFREGRIC